MIKRHVHKNQSAYCIGVPQAYFSRCGCGNAGSGGYLAGCADSSGEVSERGLTGERKIATIEALFFRLIPMAESMEKTNETQAQNTELLQQMFNAGVHIGHKKEKGHPKMKPYILTTRQNIQIINVERTAEKLDEAATFLKDVASRGGVIVVVATKMPGKSLVKAFAEKIGMPYVYERWLGGTLTNYPVLSKRLEFFLNQEIKMGKGDFSNKTKKEQLLISRDIERLDKKMGGMRMVKKMPDVLLVVDIAEHLSAVREAKRMGISVVAISDTNTNPTLVTHPIPANDKSALSISFMFDYLAKAINEGKQAISAEKQA